MNGEVQEVAATVAEAAKSTVKAAEASGGGQTGLIIAVAAAAYIFFVVVMWKLFQKAGVEPWKAVIPGLNIICLFRIMSDTDTCWGMILTGVLVLFLWCIIPVPVPKPSQEDTDPGPDAAAVRGRGDLLRFPYFQFLERRAALQKIRGFCGGADPAAFHFLPHPGV